MAILTDYQLNLPEKGVLTIEMTPPIGISGWTIEYRLTKRFGSDDYIIQNSCASGFNGVSGITVTNGAAGIMNIVNFPQYMSGKLPGPYAWTLLRTNSGHQTELARGYRLVDY